MTAVTLAMQNELLRDPEIVKLVGHSAIGSWIFADKSYGKVENSETSMIVLQSGGGWAPPNEHNTQSFPRIFVDVWSDPDRNQDKSVKVNNADEKAERLHKLIAKHFHTVDLGRSDGMPIMWGTAQQVEARMGLLVTGSQRLLEPEYSDIANGNGGRMATAPYGINTI